MRSRAPSAANCGSATSIAGSGGSRSTPSTRCRLPAGYRRSIRAAAEPEWLAACARAAGDEAQSGLYYTKDKYDAERYARLRVAAAEMMAMGSGAAAAPILDLFSHDLGYTASRGSTVRGAAFRDGRILMVRETSDGRWSLPGGWADVNQSAPDECVEREIPRKNPALP